MSRTNLLGGILMLMSIVSYGQLTEEEGTEVLDGVWGEAIFELDQGVELYSFEPEEGWYRVRREVFVDPEIMDDEGVIPQYTDLMDADKKVIGRTLEDIKVIEGELVKKSRGYKPYHAIIEGYLFKTKLEDGSAPEDRVSKILENKNRTQQLEELSELYDTYDFEERNFDEFTVRVMREDHKTLNQEKDFRLMIIFRGETTPYAVIGNDHSNISAPKVKMTGGESPFTILYLYKPPARQQELIEETILYTFLAL